jgi:hypothetical protein
MCEKENLQILLKVITGSRLSVPVLKRESIFDLFDQTMTSLQRSHKKTCRNNGSNKQHET